MKYIGVVTIEAEPAEMDGVLGYIFTHQTDGSKHFAPADHFSRTFLPLTDPTRITTEEVKKMEAAIDVTQLDPKTTMVRCIAPTGFVLYETSSCVDPAHYDEAVGIQCAMKKVEDKLFEHLGFVLQWAKDGLKPVMDASDEGAPVPCLFDGHLCENDSPDNDGTCRGCSRFVVTEDPSTEEQGCQDCVGECGACSAQ